LAYFSGSKFFTTNISYSFCRSATKFGGVRGPANRNLFPTFRELWSEGLAELDTDWMHPWIGLDWIGLDWVECLKNLDGLDWIAANGRCNFML